MSIVPNLAGYQRRRSPNVIGGQARYTSHFNLSKWIRSSPIIATSAPIRPGRFVAFDSTVAPNQYGQYAVQAVDTVGYAFVAADFAGIASVVHEDRLNRASVPQLASDPNAYANIFEHQPGNYMPRKIFDPHWIETDLAVAPAVTDVVNVLPDGRASNAGGVALPATVVFTGEIATGFEGTNYVCVNMIQPLAR